ncbi:MAG TPA: tRNA glutamyl-Q(34) synthetase GluQRS [Rickettsiales bacterium]|nr:tRNA glutamyl-Q(34) synthetase GluQRS [Rickettsiales bacterium]
MSIPVLRFAPSPNGRLHLGHAYSALLNAELAAQMKGRFLVRLEDIDTERCTVELAQYCLADLAWLGLRWEEPVRVQSRHGEDYARVLAVLQEKGVVYPCFCTRSEIAKASTGSDPDGAPLYPRICAHLRVEEVQARMAEGIPHCWRLNMEKALQAAPGVHAYQRFTPRQDSVQEVVAQPARWGDAVIARKGIMTSYHLSVVVDDALQGITHVVRGADLEAATDLHVLLQVLLGLSTPFYHHHALLTLPTGDKLSKSKGSESLADLRARGVTAQQVRRDLGFS